MQVPGHGAKVPAPVLLDLIIRQPVVRDFFLAYVHCCEIQFAQSALANARYNMNERLARWLLMCHDRLDGDELQITHEFLSMMLGTQRSSTTLAVQTLEGHGLIRARRGRITILDRETLEKVTDGCYGLPEAEFARLIEGA